MIQNRPININPLSIQLPITAIVSILHRISGILVFLLIPLLLWGLKQSLSSERVWLEMNNLLQSHIWKISIWVLSSSLVFHLLAGIRHLLMDIHIGDSIKVARISARIVFFVSLVIVLGSAFWLWR